jgi:hypothetical protein
LVLLLWGQVRRGAFQPGGERGVFKAPAAPGTIATVGAACVFIGGESSPVCAGALGAKQPHALVCATQHVRNQLARRCDALQRN